MTKDTKKKSIKIARVIEHFREKSPVCCMNSSGSTYYNKKAGLLKFKIYRDINKLNTETMILNSQVLLIRKFIRKLKCSPFLKHLGHKEPIVCDFNIIWQIDPLASFCLSI